jgi:hypothetical protein
MVAPLINGTYKQTLVKTVYLWFPRGVWAGACCKMFVPGFTPLLSGDLARRREAFTPPTLLAGSGLDSSALSGESDNRHSHVMDELHVDVIAWLKPTHFRAGAKPVLQVHRSAGPETRVTNLNISACMNVLCSQSGTSGFVAGIAAGNKELPGARSQHKGTSQ